MSGAGAPATDAPFVRTVLGLLFLLTEFVPRHRRAALDTAAVEEILVTNPARAFDFRPSAAPAPAREDDGAAPRQLCAEDRLSEERQTI